MSARRSTNERPHGLPPPPRSGAIGSEGIRGTALLLAALVALILVLASRAEAYVYWNHGGSIGRANLDGTGVNQGFITGLPGAYGGLAVDETHVNWSITAGEVFGGPDEIGRANLDGTGVGNRFITDASEPWAMAVHDEHIYWAGAVGPNSLPTIGRANLDGTGVDHTFIAIEGPSPTGVNGVAVGAGHIYWTTDCGGIGVIGRANLDGSGVEQCFIDAWGKDVEVDELGPGSSEPPGCELPPTNELPTSEFSFGKVKENKRKGTAKLTVKVPGPGELDLAKTKNVKGDGEAVEAAGKEKLRIEARRQARKKLNRKGEAKVKAKVTYTPDGGEANTETKSVKLVKRR